MAEKPIEDKIDTEASKKQEPPVDIEPIVETIKALKYDDRGRQIDLALDRQVEQVRGNKAA